MGLDFECNGIVERVGSYSFYQKQRMTWINATLLYLKDILIKLEQKQEKQEEFENALFLHKKLEMWLDTDETGEMTIDYSEVYKTPVDKLHNMRLYGLYLWVYHSDCDGYYTSNDAYFIMESLVLIKNFFTKIEKKDYFNRDEENVSIQDYYLYEIFSSSIYTKSLIKFC